MHPTHRRSLARFVEGNGCTQATLEAMDEKSSPPNKFQINLSLVTRSKDFLRQMVDNCVLADPNRQSVCLTAVFKFTRSTCEFFSS
jgi:hypothetical protein